MSPDRLTAVTREIDRLRKIENPDRRHALHLLSLFKTGAAAGYFFRNDFKSSVWLGALARAGAFRKYGRIRSARHARWIIFRELSAYLARLAPEMSHEVAEVISSISTTDQWAIRQLMRAILALPADDAAPLVPQVVRWCQPPKVLTSFIGDEHVAELMLKLARAGHLRPSLSLLNVLTKPITQVPSGHLGGGLFGQDLHLFVQGPFREFSTEFPFEALDVAARSLGRAVRLMSRHRLARPARQRTRRDRQTPDYSYVWRRAIEDHEQNHVPSFESALVEAVRDALGTAVTTDAARAETIIRRYLGARWSVFRRLGLHALRENRDRYKGLAASVAIRKQFLYDIQVYHEYWRLLPVVFNDLPEPQRTRLLRRITEGPAGSDESGRKAFAYRRLFMLRDCNLTQRARQRLDELIAEFGRPDHPDFVSYFTSSVGVTGPRPSPPLAEMTPPELFEYARTWQAEGEGQLPWEPSEAGLVSDLARVIARDPDRYAETAGRARNLPPARFYAVLDGFSQACREGRAFDWRPILRLAGRLVPERYFEEPPANLARRRRSLGPEYGWPSVRRTLADLLEKGVTAQGETRIPSGYLGTVRTILLRLVKDPEPSLRDEREHVQWQHKHNPAAPLDWFHESINTTRGEALHCLLSYVVRRREETRSTGGRGTRRVERKVRVAVSGLARDPCRTIHAAFGPWLAPLYSIDEGWARSIIGDALPSDPRQRSRWEACWSAFVSFGRLQPGLFRFLAAHYRRAIHQAAKRPEQDQVLAGLCRHLAAAYAWGWDDPSDLNRGLIGAFYRVARDDAAAAMASAFADRMRNVEGTEEQVGDEWRRMEHLLHHRARHIADSPREHAKELQAFASLFNALGKVTPPNLDGLADVLMVITAIPLGHSQVRWILEYLETQAARYPAVAARIVRRIIATSAPEPWLWEREHVESILGKIFESSDTAAAQDAAYVIERMWEAGQWQPYDRHKQHIIRLTERA